MTNLQALAAGQGGTEKNELAPEPKTPAPHPEENAPPKDHQALAPARATPPAAPLTSATRDDAYRQVLVQDLAVALMRSNTLLERCEAMAEVANFDQLGPIHAAARLMNAQAQVAKALAQAAQVERRSRTIIETIQRPDPENAGLNSILTQSQNSSPEQRAKIRDALERALLQFLEEQKQDRERMEESAI